MRTTLDIEADILDAAKALAAARGVSVGSALSTIARRGLTATTPFTTRNGLPVFQLPPDAPQFGNDDISAALQAEDLEAAGQFVPPLG